MCKVKLQKVNTAELSVSVISPISGKVQVDGEELTNRANISTISELIYQRR